MHASTHELFSLVLHRSPVAALIARVGSPKNKKEERDEHTDTFSLRGTATIYSVYVRFTSGVLKRFEIKTIKKKLKVTLGLV